MKFGISIVSLVPVRALPSEQSEMVTQLLFGDFFEIIDYNVKWFKIKNQQDGYTGWISQNNCEIISTRYFNYLSNHESFTLADPVKTITSKLYGNQLLVAGSSIPAYKGKMAFRVLGTPYRFVGRPSQIEKGDPRGMVIGLAKSYLNAPYLWGGKSTFGIDCSGFSQVIYKILGIKIPRDASQQVKHGKVIDWVNEAKPGDLAFFDNAEGKIVHVGIILDGGRIIHASGRVRIDFIDHAGICHIKTGKYTHQLRLVKNIIDHPDFTEFTPIQGQLF